MYDSFRWYYVFEFHVKKKEKQQCTETATTVNRMKKKMKGKHCENRIHYFYLLVGVEFVKHIRKEWNVMNSEASERRKDVKSAI